MEGCVIYTITLEINKVCNLRCTYCYLGEKEGTVMSEETSKAAIDMAFMNAIQHKDRKLKINFLGGEPLFNFERIKLIVDYCEKKNIKENLLLNYTISTNSILLNENMVEFFVKHGFGIKISLDGNKIVNDMNRLTILGQGSFDLVKSKFELLNYYENQAQKFVEVSNVITKNNCMYFKESLKFILDSGFRYIDTAFDSVTKWEKKDLIILEENFLESVEFYLKFLENEEYATWNLFNKVMKIKEKCTRLYPCGAGIISSYVCSNGDLYPCPSGIGTNLQLGNVLTGFDLKPIIELTQIKKYENNHCLHCEIYDYCRSKGCFVGNLSKNYDIFKTSDLTCWFTKLSFDIYKKNCIRIDNIMKKYLL